MVEKINIFDTPAVDSVFQLSTESSQGKCCPGLKDQYYVLSTRRQRAEGPHIKLYHEGRGQAQGQSGATQMLAGRTWAVFEGLNVRWTPCTLTTKWGSNILRRQRAAAAPPSKDVTSDNCHPH